MKNKESENNYIIIYIIHMAKLFDTNGEIQTIKLTI